MIMPQPRCGGGSAGTSPQRSPPRPTPDHTFTTAWTTRLAELIGADQADTLQSSVWWPALVTAVDQALQRGWRLDDLLGAAGMPDAGSVDAAQALVWRISLLADPTPTDEPGEPPFSAAPAALEQRRAAVRGDRLRRPGRHHNQTRRYDRCGVERPGGSGLGGAGPGGRGPSPWRRRAPPEQTDADVHRMFTRAMAWQECPISRDRMIEINQMALSYFRSQFPSSWGQAYLADRFGQDLTDDVRFRPGQAPAGWTGLVNHLRSRGVTGEEMTAAGVATVASTGRLIDRFRDRVIFPIIHNGEILGFVGRRHPDLTDTDRGGPKYLNTADTAVPQGRPTLRRQRGRYCRRWHPGDRGRTDGRHRRHLGQRRPLHRCRTTRYLPHR